MLICRPTSLCQNVETRFCLVSTFQLCDPVKVVHTHTCASVSKQYNLVLVLSWKGNCRTVDVLAVWQTVVELQPTGSWPQKGNEHPFTFYLEYGRLLVLVHCPSKQLCLMPSLHFSQQQQHAQHCWTTEWSTDRRH